MKKTHAILTAAMAVTLTAACILVPQVKAGAFEQKADREAGAAYDDTDIYDYEDTGSSTPSPAGKEHKAYKAFLEQYEGDVEEASSRVAGEYGTSEEIHYFSIYDLNQDGTDDLLTFEIVNIRYEKIRVYTLDNKNNVVPFLYEDGQEALFDNNHQANGAYGFYVCSEGHIHNCYNGGFRSEENIYKAEGNTIILYLTHVDDYQQNSNTYTEQGTKIGRSKYETLTEKCSEEQFSWILNNAEGRKSLGN